MIGQRLLTKLLRRSASLDPLAGLFEGSKTFDLSWTDLPSGHTRLSAAHRANDIALRYLHPRVERAPLDFVADDAVEDVFRRALLLPPTDNPPWREVPVWLTMLSKESEAVVQVGTIRVGTAVVPQAAWETLLTEARDRQTYADGTLSISGDTGTGGSVILGSLRCWLPRAPR